MFTFDKKVSYVVLWLVVVKVLQWLYFKLGLNKCKNWIVSIPFSFSFFRVLIILGQLGYPMLGGGSGIN